MVSLVETQTVQGELLTDKEQLRQEVELTVNRTPAIDVHTHVHPPAFNGLFLSGIDDLLTYHYLIAETMRSSNLSHADFWRLTKTQRADFVWKTLFVESTPLSEAARGIVSILNAFNLDTRAPNLDDARAFFSAQNVDSHIDRILEMACVSDIVMTNDPFSDHESEVWLTGLRPDPRFHASLRLDPLVNEWSVAAGTLKSHNVDVDSSLNSH